MSTSFSVIAAALRRRRKLWALTWMAVTDASGESSSSSWRASADSLDWRCWGTMIVLSSKWLRCKRLPSRGWHVEHVGDEAADVGMQSRGMPGPHAHPARAAFTDRLRHADPAQLRIRDRHRASDGTLLR